MEHDLKTWPEHFRAVTDGRKTFELREDDRQFGVGDSLLLREWCPKSQDYTGHWCRVNISHMGRGPGLLPGYVAISINTPFADQRVEGVSDGG